jgi:prevent-host-death family protein
MSVKFSKDIVPVTDLKINPGKVVKQASDTHRPILLTSRGRGIAVVQGIHDFEEAAEEREFMKAVAQGLVDLEKGREVNLEEVKKRLSIQ